MWSFDEEENKNETPENGENEPETQKPDDDFGERDPFSRGGDFYRSYSGNGGNGGEGGTGGNTPKKPKKQGGILPVMLVCAVVFAATIFIGSFLGGGNMPWGGIGAGGTSVTTSGTQATGGTGGVQSTTGTQATAPGITEGTGSTPTVSYVQWDSAVVEKCLNASVLITIGSSGGSGVIYTSDGYILTNYHVVSSNDNPITVTLYSGEKLPATYIYGDESNDIAVIRIEKNDCVYAEISTAKVTYMMPVMAIGNALGRGFSTTAGVISAPASEVYFSSTYETMTLIQVDAAINSGNSGGGLFNTAGKLIGIVNAKLDSGPLAETSIDNTGFAIPMSTVKKCVNDLREFGYVQGVARLGVEVKAYTGTNIYVVSSLASEGSAKKAGILEEDILYKFNGESISSFETLKRMLTAYSVGDTVEITVLRPTEEAKNETYLYEYIRKCDEVKIRLTFVEFNPNNP